MARDNPYKSFALPTAREHDVPSKEFDIAHVKLELTLDERAGTLEGTATLQLQALVRASRVALDAVDLQIQGASVGGKRAPFEILPGKLAVALPKPARPGEEVKVAIRYRCRPRNGVYFIRPSKEYPRKPWQVWTQGQAQDSRHWFPTSDHPNDKMTSELVLTANEHFAVRSNGKLLGVRHDTKARTKTFHWLHKVPHPAYLVAFVAGDFDSVQAQADGIPLGYYAKRGEGKRVEVLCRNTPGILRFFGELTATPYPYEKYDQAVVEDFMWGGMENTSLTTINERFLCDARHRNDVDPDGLIAHEAAHQWYGDLLTCKSWEHVWLNEGFATYLDALWHEHAHGKDEFHLRMRENARAYLDEDKTRYRRPIVTHVFTDAEDMFDRHAYPKGAWALHMIRGVLGDELFRRALAHYTKQHAGGNVETNDLKQAIESATGRNLDWFFREWLYKAGHPEFEIAWSFEERPGLVRVTVKQVQRVTDTTPETPIFRAPAEILIARRGKEERHRVELREREHVFVFPSAERPELVQFDPDGWILCTQKLDKPRDELLHELARSPGALGRIAAAERLGEMPGDPRALEGLSRALRRDPFHGVRRAAAKALGAMATREALDALRAGGQDKDPRVRRAVADAFGSFRTAEREGLAACKALLHDDSDYVAGAALVSAGKTRQRSAFALLRNALRRRSHNDVVAAGALLGIGELRDRRAIPLLKAHARPGKPPVLRMAAIQALGKLWLHCEKQQEEILEFLVDLLSDPSHQARRAAVESLADVHDERATQALQRVERHEAIGLLRRTARDVLRKHTERAQGQAELSRFQKQIEEMKEESRALKAKVNELEARIEARADGVKARKPALARTRN